MVKKAVYGFLIGLVAGIVALILWSAGALDRFEAKTWDWRPERTLDSILEEIALHAREHPDWLEISAS